MRRSLVLTALFALTVALRSVCAQPAAAAPVTLESPALTLSVDGQTGSLVDLSAGSAAHDLIANDLAEPLWTVDLADGRTLRPSDAASLAHTPSEGAVALTWTGFNRPEAPGLAVTATVSIDPTRPRLRWRIRLSGLGTLSPRAVHYPRIAPLVRQDRETVAVPVWMGEKTGRARELLNPAGGRPGRAEWEYPGLLSMQCMAVYGDGGPGLLLSTDDTGAHRKQFALFGDGAGNLGLEVVHTAAAGAAPSDSYEPPCDSLVTLFSGDWVTAAETYREWAQDQPWVKESRVRQGLVPAWVRDTGLWVWNRGRSPGVLPPALALQEAADLPVSVFWHWWHGCAYDAGFPEYLPPREGEEPFRDALSEAQRQGIHAIVYMNQRLWGMSTKSWTEEGAERFAVKGTDGKVTPEVYNTFMKSPCASMCMGTDFWRGKYAGLAEGAIRGLGVDGIYMDQACSSLACFDAAHGHPLGGGSWWMAGFQKLEADIRRRTADVKPVALAGEGCGEAWLPHLDLMLSLQVSMERYAQPGEWEPIPFFHAVYHDCATPYGNYSSLTRPPYDDLWPAEFAPSKPLELLDRKFAAQFRLEQGRTFVWGQQLTIANFQPSHLTDRAEEMQFLINLARLRQKALKYLRDGVFLRPPDIDAPTVEIPMSRLSIYAGQHDAVKEFTKVVPTVLTGAWAASDGSTAIALVNISDAEQSVRLPLPETKSIHRLTVDARNSIPETRLLDVQLAPQSAEIYELQPP